MVLHRFASLALLSGTLILATHAPVAAAATSPRTLVIGVDHQDLANQQPDKGRLFEYTDFFTRDVHIHQGDTLDFRTAPGSFHIVAVAHDQVEARKAYHVVMQDWDGNNAIGSGQKKILLGPSNGPISGGNEESGGGKIGDGQAAPFCGLDSQKKCIFSGGNDVESQGSAVPTFDSRGVPVAADWKVEIDAGPGTYSYLCFVHPGMNGRFTVVDADDHSVSTQDQVDDRSQIQFSQDRAEGLLAEKEANVVHFTGGAPGTRTYAVKVGVGTADLKVAIDEMLPQHLSLEQGDKVVYTWADPHNIHTVGFPPQPPTALPAPFAPEIEPQEGFELVGDPGTSPPGTLLTNPSTVVDSGVRVGTAYHLVPSSQMWSVQTNDSTSAGVYAYHCTVHDFMVGTLNISDK